MRIVSVCLIFILLFFLIPLKVFSFNDYKFAPATEGQVNEALQKIVPVRFLISNPLYLTISLKEIITRFFQPSASKKAEFDMILSGKRIKETYLLLLRGDVKNSSKSLALYSNRLEKMVAQLEKARSQNQEVASLVGLMAENLRLQETLLSAISEKIKTLEDSYSYSDNFAMALSSYTKAVMALDNVRPGIKDRFSLTKNYEATPEAVSSPSPSPFFQEASSSVRPKRIIY